MSINGASTICGFASWTLKKLCIAVDPESMQWGPLRPKPLLMILLPPATNEHQQSVNDFWSCIMDNSRAGERHLPILHISVALMGKDGLEAIASTSYNWAPTERQGFLWGLSEPHSNELNRSVTEVSLMRSVSSICPGIHLHNYAYNVSQIWFCCL